MKTSTIAVRFVGQLPLALLLLALLLLALPFGAVQARELASPEQAGVRHISLDSACLTTSAHLPAAAMLMRLPISILWPLQSSLARLAASPT